MKKYNKLIFTTIMILLVIISIEGMARLSYFIIYKRSYNVDSMYNYVKHSNYAPSNVVAEWWNLEIIHPYLGFAFDYNDDKKNKLTFGFATAVTPLIKREPGKLNLLILGGSVAQSMGEVLEAAFTRICRVPPNVVTLGFPGYKQPQQLLALNYFLSLGAEYDLVINADGYNDIVLPFLDNYRVGVYPFYPRNWNLRISRQPSKKILAEIGKVRYLRDLKEKNLEGLHSSLLGWSAVYGLVKMGQFKKLNWHIKDASEKLQELQQQEGKKFEETGPFFAYSDIQQLYQEAAEVWIRGSLLLDRVARASGIEYYHFIQPNQYVNGSKVLTKEEMRTAYAEKEAMAKAALSGYPILIRQGNKLLAGKINFFDATLVFAKEKQTVYIDTCCHYNARGKEILAEYILKKIAPDPKINKFFKEGAVGAGEGKN